jgi:hypothetical protein
MKDKCLRGVSQEDFQRLETFFSALYGPSGSSMNRSKIDEEFSNIKPEVMMIVESYAYYKSVQK